jgi:hypothetical protein
VVTDNSAFLIQFADLNEKSEPLVEQMLASFLLLGEDKD